MNIKTKLLTGLVATSCIATPLVALTSCAQTTDDYVADVTKGYTPSDVHKLNSTAESTLTDSMKTWFNHAAVNKITPIEEFKWSMGEIAKKIADYSSENNGIKSYTEVKKVTAGMKDFEVTDVLKRKVSYETKGTFQFSLYVDFTEAKDLPESFQKILYRADVDISYNVSMKNISMIYGDDSAILSVAAYMIPYMLSDKFPPQYIAPIFASLWPNYSENSSKLNVYPDLFSLSSSDHSWMFGINFDSNINVVAGDYEYGSYGLKINRMVDYETTLILEHLAQLPAEVLEVASIVGMFGMWRSYYVSGLSFLKLVERIPLTQDEDITKPLKMDKPTKLGDIKQGKIKIRFNDVDLDQLQMIYQLLSISQGTSSNFAINVELVEPQVVSEKYEAQYNFYLDWKTTTEGQGIAPPAGIVNEIIYLPIINFGKWVTSIPVAIEAK